MTNDQTGAAAADLAALGRQDGYRVSYDGIVAGNGPARLATPAVSCYIELYSAAEGAAKVLDLQGGFPNGWQMQETQSAIIGDRARTFQGTSPADRGGPQPAVVIFWQDGRFDGQVAVSGNADAQAHATALALALSVDQRMAAYQ